TTLLEGIDLLQRRQKCVLNQILRILTLPEQAIGYGVGALHVPGNKDVVRIDIPRSNTFDQLRIVDLDDRGRSTALFRHSEHGGRRPRFSRQGAHAPWAGQSRLFHHDFSLSSRGASPSAEGAAPSRSPASHHDRYCGCPAGDSRHALRPPSPSPRTPPEACPDSPSAAPSGHGESPPPV